MAPVDEPCCLGTVKQGELKGRTAELGPLTTYVTGTEKADGGAVLLIPDIYGFGIPNTRLFADQLAEQGFFVLLPDIFHGDPWDAEGDWNKFGEWREKHPQGPQMLQLDRLLTDVHQQYKPKTVSCIGFCWGGRHVTILAASDKVSAGVVAHGSFVTTELVQQVKQPILFLFADNDPQIDEDLRKEIESILESKTFPTKGKFYPGCGHGFTIRGDASDPKQAKGAADAFAETVSWLRSHGT